MYSLFIPLNGHFNWGVCFLDQDPIDVSSLLLLVFSFLVFIDSEMVKLEVYVRHLDTISNSATTCYWHQIIFIETVLNIVVWHLTVINIFNRILLPSTQEAWLSIN